MPPTCQDSSEHNAFDKSCVSQPTTDVAIFTAAVGDLIRVVQFRDRDRACCQGLSVSQCYALEGIASEGALTVNELSAYLLVDKSTASRIADGLVSKGLVSRVRDGIDGRIVHLVAAPEGKDVAGRIKADLEREYGRLLEGLSPQMRREASRLVVQLGTTLASRVHSTGGNCYVLPAEEGA